MSEISNEEKDIIHKQFIDWINNKYVKNIEDIQSVITLNDYKYIPNYQVELVLQYEQRSFNYNQIRPYNGEQIPKKVGALLGKWDYNLDSVDVRTKTENYYSIDDSFEKEVCPLCNGNSSAYCTNCNGKGAIKCEECKGRGEVKCEECKGKGETRCTNCNGHGEVNCKKCDGTGKQECYHCSGRGYNTISTGSVRKQERCQRCHGSGLINCSSCNGRKKENCRSCSGTGYKSCYYCDGKGEIECSKCNGEGERFCYDCNGKGIIYCRKCEGASSILKYTEIKQKFDLLIKENHFIDSGIPQELKELILNNCVFETITQKKIEYDDEKINSFIKKQDVVIQDLITGLYEELKEKIPKDSRISKVEFLILICRTYIINFHYKDTNYNLYLYNNYNYFEKEEILEKINEDLNVYFYEKFYKDKKYVEAYNILQEICLKKSKDNAKDLKDFKLKEKQLKGIISKDKTYRKELREQKRLKKEQEKKSKIKETKEKTEQGEQQEKSKNRLNAKGCLSSILYLLLFIGCIYYCSTNIKVNDVKNNNGDNNKTESICDCEEKDKQKTVIETDNYLVHYDSNTCFILHSNFTKKTYKEKKEIQDNLGFKEICVRNGYTLFVKDDKSQYVILTPKAKYYLIE